MKHLVPTARYGMLMPLALALSLFLALTYLHPPASLALNLAVGVLVGMLGVLLLRIARRAKTTGIPPAVRLVLDVVADACLVTTHDGRIVALNTAATHMFGYDNAELRDQSVEILMPKRLRTHHRRLRNEFAAHPRRRALGAGTEFIACRRDGAEFPAEIALQPIESGGAHYIAVTVRDISERKEWARIRQQISAMVENTTDFVGMADATGRLYYINAAGRAMLGLESGIGEVMVADYLSVEDLARLQHDALPAASDSGTWSGEIEFLHRDGHAIPVWLLLLAHRLPDGTLDFYSAVARDVTDRRRDSERLRRLNRTYAVLSRCNQTLIRATDERDLIHDFCTALVDTGGYRLAWFGVAQHDPEQNVTPVTHAGQADGYVENAHISWSDASPRGHGPVGRAIRTQELVLERDIDADPLFTPWREEARRRGYRSLVALPVHDEATRLNGCLSIYSSDVDAFDHEEITLLVELANDLGFGIQTLRARAARAAAESLSCLRNQVIEASRNGVMITEAGSGERPIIYVNRAFEQITGYRREEVLGKHPNFLLRDDHNQAALEAIRAALHQGRDGSAVVRNYRKDGSIFWNDLFITPVRNEAGTVTHFAGIVNDITERKLYEQQLEYQANHDQLTALPSRSLMRDRLDQLLNAGLRHRRTLAVLFLDLDQFKLVNDSLGHGIGDELLKVTATRLAACIRDGDTLCRYGGDEFVLLLPDVNRPEEINLVAKRILEAVAEPMTVQGRPLQVTISIGASLFPRDGSDAETLLKNADAAMYRAKELGRNNLQFYTEQLNERVTERLTVETELRRAIERNQLVLHYQPRVDLRTGRISGCEALVRWQHPERGLIPPGKFIPIAEENGLIASLGEWVLVEACAQNRTWQELGLPPITVAVNVSARQLALPDLHKRIGTVLDTMGLDPEDLELELTESAIMHDPAAMLRKLQLLKEAGAQLSIDDFGTGYSSLSHLSAFPFDALKIDQSFIRNVTTSPHESEIALAIIALAHSLKLRVIAEGVENEGQLRYLQRHGCDEFQGFHFSRPVPAEEFAQLLRRGKVLPPPDDRGLTAPTVLLVDPTPQELETLQRVLHREAYRLLSASHARDALEILARTQVDVVIAAQRMDDTTGTAFLRRVKEMHPAATRMVVTAEADRHSAMDALSRGDIHRCILKPWDSVQLRRDIRDCVLRHYPLHAPAPQDGV